jgi:peptidoglycan/xylan/chitin deacetylase (PgdA/CDA1 family)
VLAYHNIVPGGERSGGDASLHLRQDRFAEQLDLLASSCNVVPLVDLLTPASATGRPRVAITFDDAYRGAVTVGVAELAARGLPATIFVAPAFVGGRSFWWDALADERTGSLLAETRELALRDLRGEDERVRAWAALNGLPATEPPLHSVGATEQELAQAIQTPGITLGSHSWSHPNLSRLTEAELIGELERPIRWLRSHFASVVPWISYPYGLSSPEVERCAASAGYEGGLRVEGGWMDATPTLGNLFSLPRLNVPAGLSVDGLRIRLSGLLCG